jgi:hypothetical protein
MSETTFPVRSLRAAPARAASPGGRRRLAGALGDADFSRAIAWTSLLLGAASGLVIGLWSFGGPLPEPDWVGGYTELPRRLLRLGHIALFALGMINFMLTRQLAGSDLGKGTIRLALAAMNLGNVGMPVLLFAAVVRPEVKYLLALPALAVALALAIAATAAWRQWRHRRATDDFFDEVSEEVESGRKR